MFYSSSKIVMIELMVVKLWRWKGVMAVMILAKKFHGFLKLCELLVCCLSEAFKNSRCIFGAKIVCISV